MFSIDCVSRIQIIIEIFASRHRPSVQKFPINSDSLRLLSKFTRHKLLIIQPDQNIWIPCNKHKSYVSEPCSTSLYHHHHRHSESFVYLNLLYFLLYVMYTHERSLPFSYATNTNIMKLCLMMRRAVKIFQMEIHSYTLMTRDRAWRYIWEHTTYEL